MKLLKYMAFIPALLFMTGCSNNDEPTVDNGDAVTVTFCAKMNQPTAMSRAAAEGSNVDNVVCAVYENGQELIKLRREITVEAGKDIVYAPSLIKGRNYDIVFWASKKGRYNVTNLEAITRSADATAAETDFDAFTKSVNLTVGNSLNQNVTLVRPLARLNMGVTADDWVAVTDVFDMKPTTVTLTLQGKNKFNALTGKAEGDDVALAYALPVSGDEMQCKGTTYKNIASCYTFTDGTKQNTDITFGISSGTNAIRQNGAISNVPLQANYQTNIVGTLMTGTITYTIDFATEFASDDFNEPIN